jgi:hypothetical protein
MAELTKTSLASFHTELVKEALGGDLLRLARNASRSVRGAVTSPATHRVAGGLAGGVGAGGLAGGVLGAGYGGAKGYQEARAQGQTVGGALRAGLSAGTRQGVRGIGQGALVGGALGGVGGALSKRVPTALAQAPLVGSGARFGQRQLHGITGWTPEAGVRSIRGGAYGAERGVEEALGSLEKAHQKSRGVASAQRGLDRAVTYRRAAGRAEELGLTSLPGYAKALRKDPVGALKAGFGEQWHGATGVPRVLAYGGSGALVAGEALKDDPGGKGRLERAGRALGSTLPMLAGPLPIAASLAATPAMAAVGGLPGKIKERITRRKASGHLAAPPSLEPANATTQPSGYLYADRGPGGMEGPVG